MERKRWIHIGLIFIVIAVITGIITAIIFPYAPEYFDPENIYSYLFIIFLVIAFFSGLGAGICFLWWVWSKRFSSERFMRPSLFFFKK